MGDFSLKGLGRASMMGGGLARASQNILNTALNIRQRGMEERKLSLAEKQFERASEVSAIDLDIKRLERNKSAVELSNILEEKKRGERPVDLQSLSNAYNNPTMFQRDYGFLKANGRITTLSDGSETILQKDLKWFKENVQDTPNYKRMFNTENLVRYTNDQKNIKQEITQITQGYLDKGQTAEDAQKDKRIQQLLPDLQRATVGRTHAMLNDQALSKVTGNLISSGASMESIEEWMDTGDASKLVSTKTQGKPTDFDKAYQQHIQIAGNENVTRAEFKTGAYATPKGELTDDAVLKHFENLSLMEGEASVAEAQAGFQRFSDNQATGMSKREAFNEARDWMIRRTGIEDTSNVARFDTLFLDTPDDNLFQAHE